MLYLSHSSRMLQVNALIIFLVISSIASCSQSNQSLEYMELGSEVEFPAVDLWLSITDSIGIEFGDSNLVFGMPNVAFRMSENRIAVMDMLKAKISIFNINGSFLSTVGCQGSGPCEFLQPSWFSLTPSGGIVVSDGMGRKLVSFDSDLVYIGSMNSFFPSPPDRTMFLNDSVFVGIKPDYEMNGQEIHAGFSVALWSFDSLEPEHFYYRELALFDPANPFNSEAAQPIFTMSPEGTVYTSVRSTDEFSIHAWNLDGSLLFTITEPYIRKAKTQEEVDQELETTRSFMRRAGMPDSFLNSIGPEPYYYAITSLGVGPDGNLWVALGIYGHPVFRVYDPNSGEYLFTAALECPENKRELSIIMNKWGFIALNPMSDKWPRVYILNPKAEY